MKHVSSAIKSRQLIMIERNLKKKDEFYSRFRYPDWAKRCLLSLLVIEKDVDHAETTEVVLEAMAELVTKNTKKHTLTLIKQGGI